MMEEICPFIHKCPLLRSIEIIRPKLEHLLAFGFSPSELITAICFWPFLLDTSLKQQIEPNLNILDATFGSKADVIKVVNRGPWHLRENLEKHVIPNLNLLRINSIPMEMITLLFAHYPLALKRHPDVIIETIGKLRGMGMRPSTLAFIHGITAVTTTKKETWEKKMKLYEGFGWLETDTLSAFSRQPMCMQLSEEKIKKQMEFFMKKLEWDSAMVLRWPIVLTYSLEKRVIPRCAVLSVLAKNGLWNGKPKLCTLLNVSEENFGERFVDKYEKEVPEVIDAYQGKIDFVGIESTVVGSLGS